MALPPTSRRLVVAGVAILIVLAAAALVIDHRVGASRRHEREPLTARQRLARLRGALDEPMRIDAVVTDRSSGATTRVVGTLSPAAPFDLAIESGRVTTFVRADRGRWWVRASDDPDGPWRSSDLAAAGVVPFGGPVDVIDLQLDRNGRVRRARWQTPPATVDARFEDVRPRSPPP